MVENTDAARKTFLGELQKFIDRPREGWILQIERANAPISTSLSKFGGLPYSGNFIEWPTCPKCKLPLNFVLQLNQRRFPQMWFPRGKNLFQIFRCPNGGCGWKKWRESDRYILSNFTTTSPGHRRKLVYPNIDVTQSLDYPELPFEDELKFRSRKIRDYPSFYEGRESWWGKSWVRFQKKYDKYDWFYDDEKHWDKIPNVEGIKIGGLPSWQQSGYPPKCKCGRRKTFVFQLASVYNDDAEISIGDAGNIYYFACKRCGEKSLETCWDCG